MLGNLGHLMLDLETLGNESHSVICSIGAVEFDIATGKTGRTFYEKVSIQSCLDVGLKVNGSTIEWWLEQNEAARKEISVGGKNIVEVLYKFRLFLETLGTENLQIWGNSVRFDCGILEDAYKATKHQIPWNFRLERDVRTLVELAPELKRNAQSVGTAHLPIDDCLFQIQYCCAIWKKVFPHVS
jgi:3' exoribonuclease, RNase T-like